LADICHEQMTLAAASVSTAMVAAMNFQVLGEVFEQTPWPEAAIARAAQAVLKEGALINAAASEPAMGSPSRGRVYASTAQRDESGCWGVTAHKTWVTGGQHLTHLSLKLMVDGEPGSLWLPMDTPGLRWENTWRGSLGLRATDSHDLYIEGAVLPPEALLQRGEGGAAYPNAWFPMMLAAVYLGGAIGARDDLIRYCLERTPTALGQPIASLPKIQRAVGEMDMILSAARALLLEVAGLWEKTPTERPALYYKVAAAKQFSVEAACRATELALIAAGGAALTPQLSLERAFRDVRAGQMQPPAGETALEIIGRGAMAAQQASEPG
jgi:alkylation response protein AidB-like acyl-CoA dehydrogenase